MITRTRAACRITAARKASTNRLVVQAMCPVGSVILDGNSQLSVGQTAAIAAQLQAAAPSGVGLFISTDQEGGQVQRMRGPGFQPIASAVAQGGLASATLRSDAKVWGAQLAAAGITWTSRRYSTRCRPASGAILRSVTSTASMATPPAAVTSHAVAVAQGLADADVDATAKHFPGLGRVRGNTDTTAGVTDSVTTRNDAYLAPFAAAVAAGVPFVMMSTAIYSLIDSSQPAAFSSTIITGMLRQQLGFGGVVISDDLGAAKQVAAYPPGERAVDFIAAGGDIVLTVTPDVIAAMTAAVLARVGTDPTFAKQVDAAALRVLEAKDARGLL